MSAGTQAMGGGTASTNAILMGHTHPPGLHGGLGFGSTRGVWHGNLQFIVHNIRYKTSNSIWSRGIPGSHHC